MKNKSLMTKAQVFFPIGTISYLLKPLQYSICSLIYFLY